MTSLKVLAITSYGPHTALTGGRLRRDNVVAALRGLGHRVDRVDVPARPGVAAGLKSFQMSTRRVLLRRVRSADVVLLGDIFCLPAVPLIRAQRVPVVADLVDSAYRLVGSTPRNTWRQALAAALECAQLVPVMHGLVPLVSGVSYISRADLDHDAERIGRRFPLAEVVPNGIDQQLRAAPLVPPRRDGYIAWLADWTYAPNRESLSWFVDQVLPHLPDEVAARIRLFGPGDPLRHASLPPDGRWTLMASAGFVEDLFHVYRDAAVVIAPVVRGAGINNKVLEPLAAGRAVVTTEVGGRGLSDAMLARVRRTADPQTFATLVTQVLDEDWDAAEAQGARDAVTALSWSDSGERMACLLHRVVRSARGDVRTVNR